MTGFIETYSGYVLLYLLVGLALQLTFAVLQVRQDLVGTARYPVTDGSLSAVLLIYLVGPLLLSAALVSSVGGIVWNALKAWKRFLRPGSGSEELVFSAFWLYMAGMVAVEIEDAYRWWFVAICAVTALFLMQAARAMQQLKKGTAQEVGEQLHQEPPPHIMDRYQELRAQVARDTAARERAWRDTFHHDTLAELRQQASTIQALTAAHDGKVHRVQWRKWTHG